MIAVFFIALAIVRIFVRYYSYDPILEKFFQASLAALFVFTISHIVEYFSMSMGAFVNYSDHVLVNTVNFYLISLLLIAIGAEAFLKVHDSRSAMQIRVLIGLIVTFVVLIFVFTTKTDLISLELDEPTPYIYTLLVFAFGLMTLMKVKRIGKYVAISTGFTRFLLVAISLIMLSTVPYIFYDLLEETFGLPIYQIMYLSHFLFYAAVSWVFLAFGRIKISGGVYADL
jgi:hypothetical protein